jgi:hypothetical protein
MSAILSSIAELSAKKKAEAEAKLKLRIDQLAQGATIDPVADPQLCQDAGVTLEYLADRVEKRLRLIDELRISLERPKHDSKVDEANKEIARIDKLQDDANKKFDEKRRHWKNQKNIAVASAQRCREAASYVARNSDSPAIDEAREHVRKIVDRSNAIATERRTVGQKINMAELIIDQGMQPNGGSVNLDQIEKARLDLVALKKRISELDHEYELLQLIAPVASENVIRIAIGQEALPYPIDYRRDTIGRAVPIYAGENSADDAQLPSDTKEGTSVDASTSVDAEAKRIQAETAARATSTPPTRGRKETPPTVTESDLDII